MVPMVSSCGGETIGNQAARGLGLDETSEDDQQGNGPLGAAAKRLSSTHHMLAPTYGAVMPPVRICAGGDPSRKVKGRPYRDALTSSDIRE
jgi:hypothetical protein